MELPVTDADWRAMADRFRLTPDELADYREAFADVARLGVEAFIDLVFDEAVAALVAAKKGVLPDAATLRRCVARKTVVVELLGGQEMFSRKSGPVH